MKDPHYPGMDEDEADPSMTGSGEGATKKDEDSEGSTALLPKSFFEGQELKPGQQFYVEIVRSYEDEVEVKYPHQVKEEGQHDEANEKLDAMGAEMGTNPGASGGGY